MGVLSSTCCVNQAERSSAPAAGSTLPWLCPSCAAQPLFFPWAEGAVRLLSRLLPDKPMMEEKQVSVGATAGNPGALLTSPTACSARWSFSWCVRVQYFDGLKEACKVVIRTWRAQQASAAAGAGVIRCVLRRPWVCACVHLAPTERATARVMQEGRISSDAEAPAQARASVGAASLEAGVALQAATLSPSLAPNPPKLRAASRALCPACCRTCPRARRAPTRRTA